MFSRSIINFSSDFDLIYLWEFLAEFQHSESFTYWTILKSSKFFAVTRQVCYVLPCFSPCIVLSGTWNEDVNFNPSILRRHRLSSMCVTFREGMRDLQLQILSSQEGIPTLPIRPRDPIKANESHEWSSDFTPLTILRDSTQQCFCVA